MNNKRNYVIKGSLSLLILLFFVLRINDEGKYIFFDLESNLAISSVCWVGIFAWIGKLDKWKNGCAGTSLFCNCLKGLGCLFFALVSMAEKYYISEMDFNPLTWFQSPSSCLGSAAALMGGFFFYWCLMDTIVVGIGYLRKEESWSDISFFDHIVDGNNVTVKSALSILIIWAPQILVRFPGAMSVDGWTSLYQYWNPEHWSDQHPVIYTLLLGKCADLGLSLGRIEYGIFPITLGQVLLHVFVFGYCLSVMKFFNISKRFRIITWAFFAFLPIFPAFATTLMIDSGYCASFLLLITEVYIWIEDPGLVLRSPKHWILVIAGTCGLFLRYNGIYILLLLLASIVLEGLYALKQKKAKLCEIAVLVLLIMLSTATMRTVTTALTDRYAVIELSERGRYAVIIQQLGRCALEHPEGFTEADIEDMESIIGFPFETIRERYSSYSFDRLKGKFNVNAGQDQMQRFRKLWFRMLKDYPMTCINATLEQNYYLFSISARNNRYYLDFITGARNEAGYWDYSGLCSYSKSQNDAQFALRRLYYSFEYLPVLGLFSNQAIYTIMLFAAVLQYLNMEDRKKLILLIPMLGTLGICLIAPACKNHARYLYPLVYCMPVIWAAVTSKNHGNQKPYRDM